MVPVRSLIAASLLCSAPALAQWGQPSPQYPPGGSQGAYGPGMQAGGLAPPSAPAEDPEAARTEAELARAEEEDSGRGLEWVWLGGEVGAEHLRLDTFSATGRLVPGIEQTNQTGLAVGAGLGLRLVFVTLGPRFRLASFYDFQLWTLGGELGLRIPLGSVEPYFTVGGGYASLGAFDARSLAGVDAGQVDVTGYYARVGGGLDLYLTPVFSIGASLTGELVALTRPGVNPSQLGALASGGTPGTPEEAAQARAQAYAADGSSAGLGLTGTAVLGLHF